MSRSMHVPFMICALGAALVSGVKVEAQQMRQDGVGLEAAQIARRPVVRTPPRRGLGVRAFFLTDVTQMTATESFTAVASPRFTGVGGGAELLRLWHGLFLRVAGSTANRTGERAVVFDKEAVRIGVPLKLTVSPLEVGAGWRMESGRTRALGSYVGGGLLRLRYKEASQFAVAGENVDESFNGYFVFGGVDFTIGRALVVGGEAQFRAVPNAIGQQGVSQAFGETDLGGATVRFLVGIRH
ncbi:MAG: hypothetical protein ABI051_15975 [Vicinamibacterales bacterium]